MYECPVFNVGEPRTDREGFLVVSVCYPVAWKLEDGVRLLKSKLDSSRYVLAAWSGSWSSKSHWHQEFTVIQIGR